MPVVINGVFFFKLAEFFQVTIWPMFLVSFFVTTITYQKWLFMVVLFHSLGVSFPFFPPVTYVPQLIWQPPIVVLILSINDSSAIALY